MEDLIKWYNTFTINPEAVGLSKESLKNLTMPIQPLGIPGLNASFAQGIVATGNKNVTNKVRTPPEPMLKHCLARVSRLSFEFPPPACARQVL